MTAEQKLYVKIGVLALEVLIFGFSGVLSLLGGLAVLGIGAAGGTGGAAFQGAVVPLFAGIVLTAIPVVNWWWWFRRG